MLTQPYECFGVFGDPFNINEESNYTETSDSGSILNLPLPSITDSEPNTSRTKEYPKDSPKIDRKIRNFKFPISQSENHSEKARSPDCRSRLSMNQIEIDTSKVFSKFRSGGRNIVESVRKSSGNSYLAKKKRMMEMMKLKPGKVLKKREDADENSKTLKVRNRSLSLVSTPDRVKSLKTRFFNVFS